MRFEAKEEEEEIHSADAAPAPLVKAELAEAVSKNEVKEAKEAVVEVVKKEEEVKEEEEQEEKRKKEGNRRRRKKHGSEDPEEGAGGHRVVICDDQVQLSNFNFMSS